MHTPRLWLIAIALALVLVAIVDVTIDGPRVAVRWRADLSDVDRAAREERYSLENGRRGEGPEWQYELGDRSTDNIRALVEDAAAEDTGYIDRSNFEAERPQVTVRSRIELFRSRPDSLPRGTLFIGVQSVCALLCAWALLWVAGRGSPQARRRGAVAALSLFAASAYLLPLDPDAIRMGDASTYVDSFESYLGVKEVRFEAHLSQAIAGRIYRALGTTEDAPARALDLLMRGATAWFVLMALAIGALEQWSSTVVRYLALTLFAPSALMYFGYVEFGHLSLNAAAFPLLVKGLQGAVARLRAASVLAGLGAALHGFGLLSLAGTWLAALVAPARIAERLRRAIEISAWGAAAYVGWIAIYLIVLGLPVTQGHADAIPWRPLLVDRIVGDRVNAAILSATGARDLLFTGWAVGAPLLFVAASLWQMRPDLVRVALVHAIPSIAFSIAFWPVQGLGVEMDLVFGAFPAIYALAWVCAQEWRHTVAAAVLLASAHAAFWTIVLNEAFVN